MRGREPRATSRCDAECRHRLLIRSRPSGSRGRGLVRGAVPAVVALLGLGLAGDAAAATGAYRGMTGVAVAAPAAASAAAPVGATAGDRGEVRSANRHGTRERRRTRSRVVYRPYRGAFGWGSFGWYGGFGSFWPYYVSPYAFGQYGPYGWGPVGYATPDAGAVDINTKPRKASVYLDGELIGRVDAFDGFPRYLWLREGSYRLAIFMEGHQTLERTIRVRPGVLIRIDQDLAPGTAVQPRPPASAPAERTREKRSSFAASAPPGESWRVENRGRPIEQDQRTAPARLVLDVQPADAVVYLDGRLLGSGAELASLLAPLIIDPGLHRLEVTRPGHASAVRAFEAAKGEDLTLRIELQPE